MEKLALERSLTTLGGEDRKKWNEVNRWVRKQAGHQCHLRFVMALVG